MLIFPIDSWELYFDGIIATGGLSGAIPEANLRKISLLTPPEFQIMVANGQLEAPLAMVKLQFEVGDIKFNEKI